MISYVTYDIRLSSTSRIIPLVPSQALRGGKYYGGMDVSGLLNVVLWWSVGSSFFIKKRHPCKYSPSYCIVSLRFVHIQYAVCTGPEKGSSWTHCYYIKWSNGINIKYFIVMYSLIPVLQHAALTVNRMLWHISLNGSITCDDCNQGCSSDIKIIKWLKY